MANLVQITVKATDASSWDAIKARAGLAGAAAADAFNDAFKLRADARDDINERIKATGSLGGEDKQLMSKLKSYANTPGGIGILGTGNDTSLMSMLRNQIRQMGQSGGPGLLSTGAGGPSSEDLIKQVMTGASPGNVSTEDIIRQVMEGSGPSNVTTKDIIDQVMQGNSPGNVTTKDLIDQILEGTGPANVTTKDFVDQIIEGRQPGNIDTKDIIHPTVDDDDIKELGDKDGKNYGSSFASSVKDALSKMLGSGGGSFLSGLLTGGVSGGEGGISSVLNSGGVAGGALPGIMGLSGLQTTIVGISGALIAVLPALTAVLGGLTALGGGFAILEETDAKFAAKMSSTLSSLESVFKAAAMPLAQPLEQAATQIVGYFKQIEPDLKAVFADSGQLVEPLVKGFEALMSGAGPGFLAMIKSAGPVFQTVGQAFANLGSSLGKMFSDFASDGAGSASILKSFLEIINAMLPLLGQLGQIFVQALGPPLVAFSGGLSKVLSSLGPFMSVVGQLAGAVLGDLAGVLEGVGNLLTGLAPSFTTLAKVAGNLFLTLENTGAFAALADVLENIVPAFANLVNVFVQGIAPALPGIISMFKDFYGILITLLSAGLDVLLNALAALLKFLSPILPALADIVAAVRLWTIAQGLLDIALDANPIGLFVLALGLLIGAIVEVYDHWNTIWNGAKEIFADFEIFMLEGLRDIVSAFTDYVGTTLNLAAKAFGWVPGVGGLLRTAASDFDTYRANVSNDFNTMINQAQSWRDSLSSFPKGVTTTLKLAGTGEISINASGAYIQGESGHITAYAAGTAAAAAGWAMVGEQGPELIKLNGGEQVVPNHKLPGFAGGTPGADLQWMQDLSKSIAGSFNVDAGTVFDKAFTKALAVAWAEHHLTAAASGGPGGGAPAANAALAKKLFPQWATGINWTDWNNVAMRESGWNQFATNPGSGAYGIPQALPFTKMPKAAWPASAGGSSNPTAQISWMAQYMESVYGGPQGAWAHELSAGWYDKGGWLPTGASIAINNTGRPEPVGAAIGAQGGGDFHITLELGDSFKQAGLTASQLEDIRYSVRTKGGGSVQAAFGRS